MTTMAPPRLTEPRTRPAELAARRVRLITGPAAAAHARGQVRVAIGTWHAPVDADVAVLLTSDLVTDALRHEAGEVITLALRCGRGRLRVDVHGTSRLWPVPADGPGIAPGLALVTRLSAEWGFYRTPTGTVVYFTLALQPHLAEGGGCG
jgi:hypothetical protein